MAGDDVIVGRGHIPHPGARRLRVGQAGDGGPEILDQERHPGKGPLPRLLGRHLPGPVQVGVDHSVEAPVESLDAPGGGIKQLEGMDPAGAHQLGKTGGVVPVIVGERPHPILPLSVERTLLPGPAG